MTQAVDPDGKHEDGDVVHYGDSVLLVDDRNLVWNDNVSNAEFEEAKKAFEEGRIV